MAVEPSPSPFDLVTDLSSLLAWCGLKPESVQGVATAAQVEDLARQLAEPFAGLSREQAAGFVRACVVGYLLASARSARMAEQWRAQILTVIGDAYDAGTMEPGLYGALLAHCTTPEHVLVVPERGWPAH